MKPRSVFVASVLNLIIILLDVDLNVLFVGAHVTEITAEFSEGPS